MGVDDFLRVSDTGLTVFGSSGMDVVAVSANASSLVLDQAIERINLAAPLSTYSFKQTGNQINVYNNSGATLVLTVPVQGDADGTILSFSDGMASARVQTDGVMLLGGAVVSNTTPSPTSPVTAGLSPNTPTLQTTTKTQAFLGTSDNLTITTNGLTVYGSSGADVVTMGAAVSGVVLSQAVEVVRFGAGPGSYTFKQTGNQINVFDSTGGVQLLNVTLQNDADGTVLSFAGNSVSATIGAGGIMRLGGLVVSNTSPAALPLSAAPSPSATTVAVASGNDAAVGQTAAITLTGLSSAQGSALFSPSDLNTVFGAGFLV